MMYGCVQGVETTRKFLLEWLSFMYRYVPVGSMGCPPQKMNERPPKFHGRDPLEELMASPNSADWIKIRFDPPQFCVNTIPELNIAFLNSSHMVSEYFAVKNCPTLCQAE